MILRILLAWYVILTVPIRSLAGYFDGKPDQVKESRGWSNTFVKSEVPKPVQNRVNPNLSPISTPVNLPPVPLPELVGPPVLAKIEHTKAPAALCDCQAESCSCCPGCSCGGSHAPPNRKPEAKAEALENPPTVKATQSQGMWVWVIDHGRHEWGFIDTAGWFRPLTEPPTSVAPPPRLIPPISTYRLFTQPLQCMPGQSCAR